MKTLGFGSISVDILDGGLALVRAYSPTLGHFELPLSPDELMIFLVDTSNALAEGRAEELKKRQAAELEAENKRGA
jgi:hypothetical protein